MPTLRNMANVLHVPAFEDNYIWLIQGNDPARIAIIDPGDAAPVIERLERDALTPAAILCTHHHGDHVGGVETLVERYGIPVYGPANEPIPARTCALTGGERIEIPGLGLTFAVLPVPGHTRGHIAYYGEDALFCGDTLFSAGCGRLFEGTAAQLFVSLASLHNLPDDTRVYCAHEYTAFGLRFTLAIEPDNRVAREHAARVSALRREHAPSLPSTIRLEKHINAFLRTGITQVRAAAERYAGRELDTELEVFTVLRGWRDVFRG